MKPNRVAIVAEWLTWRGGGEAVIDALLEVFPHADLYTTVYNEKNLPEYKKFSPRTSFLQKIPVVRKRHQTIPPLLLKAIESLDLTGHDLIISSSSSIGKGIKKPSGAIHICYCHTPMRYIWQPDIDKRLVRLPLGKNFINFLKKWDLNSNKGVDYFITNSDYTRKRIKKFYNREATVIYPPVETGFASRSRQKEDFYLCLGRLVEYKRCDLAIICCEALGKKLIVAGDGPELKNLQKLGGKHTKFVGRVNEMQKAELMSKAKALIFPGEEDFGIVPIEAMACATGVIAYDKGGVCESVVDGKTGILFKPQTTAALKEAILRFERKKLDPRVIRSQGQKFSEARFKTEIEKFVEKI